MTNEQRERERVEKIAAILHRWYGPDRVAEYDDLDENARGPWRRDAQFVVNVALSGTAVRTPRGETTE